MSTPHAFPHFLGFCLPLLLAFFAMQGHAHAGHTQLGPWQKLRRRLFGKPIANKDAHHEKLGTLLGLPVFSSDALSSVAYATEAILGVVVLAGAAALGLTWPITLGICALIVIVAISYRQTIFTYPSGGGSYVVASENLGRMPGLIAGGALLIDYVLTVAVSVAAGVAAITSAYPVLHPYPLGGLGEPARRTGIGGGVCHSDLRVPRGHGAHDHRRVLQILRPRLGPPSVVGTRQRGIRSQCPNPLRYSAGLRRRMHGADRHRSRE